MFLNDTPDSQKRWELKRKAGIPLQVLSMSDLQRRKIDERPKLLPWLPQGGLVMIVAAPGVGKTIFTMGVASAISRGGSFLKWYNPEPYEALYIDGEMSLKEMRERLASIDPDYAENDNLSLISHEVIWQGEERDLNIDSEEFQARIKSEVSKRQNLKLVVIDNLSCLTPHTAENERDAWARNLLPFFLWFRRRGIAVIILHHSGKDKSQRGTSSRIDQLDTVIHLDRVTEDFDEEKQGAHFVMRFTKKRSLSGDDAKPLEVQVSEGRFTWKPFSEAARDRFLLFAHDGIDSVSDMAEALGIDRGYCSRIKAQLQKQGVLKPGKSIRPR